MSRPQSQLGNVQALRRLHVLVVAGDRRFQRVAGFMLERCGYRVSILTRLRDVIVTVERKRPDVVVLDATSSLSDSARIAAALEAIAPRTTVVLVSEDDRVCDVSALTNLEVHPKWDAFAELSANLERIHLGIAPAAEGL